MTRMSAADVVPLKESLRRFERWYWIEALRRGRTVTGAARIAAVDRRTVIRALHRTGLLNALGLELAIAAGARAR